MKRLALAATAALTLSACKTQIAADLFTSDLIAATEGETLTAPLVIFMESTTEEKCNETAPDVLAAVQTQHPDAEFIGCEDQSYETFARFRVQARILARMEDAKAADDAFAIWVQEAEGTYHVRYLMNPAGTRAIWDALPEEMTQYQTYNLEPELFAMLNNDLRSKVTVLTDDVFADGSPVQGTATHELARRDQIELRMSNVTNAAFGSIEKTAHIVSFTPKD